MSEKGYQRKPDDRCWGYEYGSATNMGENGTMVCACMFIDRMKERRGCEAGDKCTRYTPKTGKRWNAYDGLWPAGRILTVDRSRLDDLMSGEWRTTE